MSGSDIVQRTMNLLSKLRFLVHTYLPEQLTDNLQKELETILEELKVLSEQLKRQEERYTPVALYNKETHKWEGIINE